MKKRGAILLTIIMALSLVCSIFGFTFAYAQDSTPVNYATTQTNWNSDSKSFSLVSFGDDGMAIGLPTADWTWNMAFGKKVAKDSTLSLELEGKAPNVPWGTTYVMFKADDAAPLTTGGFLGGLDSDVATSTGNWLALCTGDAAGFGVHMFECNNGKVTKTDLTTQTDVYNHHTDFKNMWKQNSAIEITTQDTTTGVDVTIKFIATGDAVSGEQVTVTYTSTNTDLHGDYSIAFGGVQPATADKGDSFIVKSITGNIVEPAPAVVLENLAANKDYWANAESSINPKAFQFNAETGIKFMDTNEGALVSNQTIVADSTIKIVMDNTYPETAAWAKFYFVFKNKDKVNPVSGLACAASGNYLALELGSDGAFIHDCVNGTVTKTDINGGNLDANDVWFWHKRSLTIVINTVDTETGVNVTVELRGASVKATSYTSTNTALKGDGYASVNMFLAEAGTDSANVNISSLTVSGIEEGKAYIPEIDVDSLNSQASSIIENGVNADNLDSAKALVVTMKEAQPQMSLGQAHKFVASNIEAVETKIATYEKVVSDAVAVDALIEALPTNVTADNYATAKTDIAAARSAYDLLDSAAQVLVTKSDVLNAAEQALSTYENTLKNAAAAVDALIDALPANVIPTNLQTAKAAAQSAREAYTALSEEAKAFVTKIDVLTEYEANLQEIEDAINGSGNQGGNEGENQGGNQDGNEDNEEKETIGCGGSAVGAGLLLSVISMTGAVISIRKRKE